MIDVFLRFRAKLTMHVVHRKQQFLTCNLYEGQKKKIKNKLKETKSEDSWPLNSFPLTQKINSPLIADRLERYDSINRSKTNDNKFLASGIKYLSLITLRQFHMFCLVLRVLCFN